MEEERFPKQKHHSAEANLFSRLFFLYSFNSVDSKFDPNVIYSPLICHRSEILGARLERSWSKQKENSENRRNKNIISESIVRVFWLELLKTVIVSFIEIFLRIAETVCLGFVLSYFQPNSTMSELHVLYWSIGMLVSIGLRIFAHAHQRCQTLDTTTKIRVACSNLIYRKALRLKTKTLQKEYGNNIVTLITKDLNRFDMKMELINYVYTAPIVIIAVVYIMYQEFGMPGLVGIVFILLVTVIQVFSANYTSKLQFLINQLSGERIRLMEIFLSGIYEMKIFVWEDSLAKLIGKARTKELIATSKSFVIKTISVSVFTFVVPICIFLALYAVILEKEEITVAMVFIMLIYYSLLNYIVSICFTSGLAKLFEICVVLKRVNDFMNIDEFKLTDRKNEENNDKVFVRLDNIFATWAEVIEESESGETFDFTNSTEKTALLEVSKKCSRGKNVNKSKTRGEFPRIKDLSFLRNVSLKIEGDEMLGIIGQVGSGKSSLLQVILGEILVSSGSKNISGKISYASQVPWTFTSTIRQNILFGLEYDESRYSEVIRVCGLESDFQQFPERDLTSIGDGGVHLSIGFKKRINLARAVYRNADIYLLDDPFSGVDMQMANYLFDECILGFLKNKCRILVTLEMGQLKNADNLIYMNNGRIEKEGSYEDLLNSGLLGYNCRAVSTQPSSIQDFGEDYSIFERDVIYRQINRYSEMITNADDAIDEKIPLCQEPVDEMNKSDKTRKEDASLFKYLLASNKKCVLGTIILLFILNQIIISSIFYYLGAWSTAEETRNAFRFLSPIILNFFGLRSEFYYENYFGLLVLILIVAAFAKSFFYCSLIKADSKTIHDTVLEKITCANLRFYDLTKMIRILNTFSRDLNIVDAELPEAIMESSQFILMMAGSFVLLILVDISFAAPTVILLLFFVALFFVFSKSIGDFARMENKLFSQVLDHLSISSQGIITSRAISAQGTLINKFENHQDNYHTFWYLYGEYCIAMSFYVDMSCFLFFLYVTIVLVFQAKQMGISNGFIGVAFTQAIGLIGIIQYMIRKIFDVRDRLKAVERLSRYKNLEKEEEPQFRVEPSPQWPDEGKMVFNNVCLRYDTDLPIILKNLSFVINPREKIGIVGNNGAGKSSIIAAMLRLFIVDGCIEIDGFDSRDISTKLLRSKISVIPQDPILFAANLRFNLDPFDAYDDHTLYRTIQALELEDPCGQVYGLDYEVKDGGTNFSVGQKHLICLARALIRKNKILIVDEATQHLDPRTDASIQNIIRRKFRDCTVITISDRLNTLVNSDKVIVMKSGKFQEYDHPHMLLQNRNGQFYKMVLEAGPSEAEKLKKTAFENYIKWKIL